MILPIQDYYKGHPFLVKEATPERIVVRSLSNAFDIEAEAGDVLLETYTNYHLVSTLGVGNEVQGTLRRERTTMFSLDDIGLRENCAVRLCAKRLNSMNATPEERRELRDVLFVLNSHGLLTSDLLSVL